MRTSAIKAHFKLIRILPFARRPSLSVAMPIVKVEFQRMPFMQGYRSLTKRGQMDISNTGYADLRIRLREMRSSI